MKKLVMVVVAAVAAQVYAERCQCLAEAGTANPNNTPHIVKQVRSPLGKEIDGLRTAYAKMSLAQYETLTNLAARVAALEAAEAARVAEQAERKAKAAERKEARDRREENRKALEAAKARAKGLKQNAAAKAAKAAREGK